MIHLYLVNTLALLRTKFDKITKIDRFLATAKYLEGVISGVDGRRNTIVRQPGNAHVGLRNPKQACKLKVLHFLLMTIRLLIFDQPGHVLRALRARPLLCQSGTPRLLADLTCLQCGHHVNWTKSNMFQSWRLESKSNILPGLLQSYGLPGFVENLPQKWHHCMGGVQLHTYWVHILSISKHVMRAFRSW